MRRGFTLIELLVASLLLGMLVMILTSIFGQSSIAWTTGVNGALDMRDARQEMSNLQRTADTLLDDNNARTQELFRDFTGNNLNDRAYSLDPVASGYSFKPNFNQVNSWSNLGVGGTKTGGEGITKTRSIYTVGVTSKGPDGVLHTWDDVTTWPAD